MNHLFKVGIDDAQIMAGERFGRELSERELRFVQRCVESGLFEWGDVLKCAMDSLVEEDWFDREVSNSQKG